jgi:two-component system, sensor histidine kinase and response regulator
MFTKGALAPPPAAARILVAEDNPLSAELLRDHLTSLGYEVDCAPDGNRALNMAGSGDYGLMLLDVNMPVYDGVEVLRMLRRRLLLRPIKVIVVTADRLATRREELTQDGIDGYLTKPLDLDELSGEVDRVLRSVPAYPAGRLQARTRS